ncbi:MAG: PQQ-binding-like beta-propeller repeat protein [Chloroherpetonaceae bacterium]|nr:PQQ-binding-like beta-propeller repeat protein [Chthonomonadaceae bacterium]MDW8208972.1 PQQ-binding-like beta-propeller repeat protein [Chloroherpetonaceae bacterium]
MFFLRRICRTTVWSALLLAGALTGTARSQDTARDTTPAPAKVSVPMAVHWKFSTTYAPNNPASPTVSEDTIYFSSGNRLYAVDRATGAQKWRYPSDNTLTGFIAATPTVAEDTVFFSTTDGMYALNTADGRQRWPHINIKGGAYTTPIVLNNTVYFASSNGRLYAVDARTGASIGGIWKRDNVEGLPIGDLIADVAIADETLYYVTSDEVITAINLSNGARRWAQRLTAADPRTCKPVVSGETLYVAAGSNLVCMRRANGQLRWSLPFPNNLVAPPAVDSEGNAYVVTGDRQVYAIDPRGRALWKQPAQVEYEVIAEPLAADNHLFVATTMGHLYAFDTATGALRWHYAIQPSSSNPMAIPSLTNVAARPIVAGGTLFVLSDDGALTAFRADAADTLPPIVNRLEPEQGDYLNGRPPFRLAAKIIDDGSGLNLNTLTMQLDGTPLRRREPGRENADRPGYAYNPDTGMVEYIIFATSGEGRAEVLRDGHHTVTVSVQDWKGNTATRTWTFYIDDTLRKRSRIQRPASTTNQPNRPGRPNRGGGGSGDERGGGPGNNP